MPPSKALLIEGLNKKGTLPEENSSNIIDILYFQESASITKDNTLFIPFVFSKDAQIKGIYLYVRGAENYWDIPVNVNPVGINRDNASPKSRYTESVMSSYNTYVLSVGIPENILKGNFEIVYKLYDTFGNIGNSKSLRTEIVEPINFCLEGQTLGRVEGQNGMTVRTYELGNSSGWVSVEYDTYSVRDRIDIRYGSEWIRSTGSLLGNQAPPIKECSQASASDGFVGKRGVFNFFYDPEQSRRLDIYVSGCLGGGTQWWFNVQECPKEKPSLGIHSNAGPSEGLTDGHAWISLTENGKTTLYGLWPDFHPLATDNGTGSV